MASTTTSRLRTIEQIDQALKATSDPIVQEILLDERLDAMKRTSVRPSDLPARKATT